MTSQTWVIFCLRNAKWYHKIKQRSCTQYTLTNTLCFSDSNIVILYHLKSWVSLIYLVATVGSDGVEGWRGWLGDERARRMDGWVGVEHKNLDLMVSFRWRSEGQHEWCGLQQGCVKEMAEDFRLESLIIHF
jgi:hypothetical protein